MIGRTLGHYRVEEQLGAGGMGVVYRATDTRLHRDVALKVLPEKFVHDPERMKRFEREAHLLASLNHPNIAAIYDFYETEGIPYLVMELVRGKTLAGKLAAGPLLIEIALGLFLQLSEALEAAHEAGVIHRDLKPQNLMITPEGKLKVLDFGLAKAFAEAKEIGNIETLAMAPASGGIVMGTGPYMSPEQIRGEEAGRPIDIWAFGCVLFESLTGHRAFQGETLFETAAAVLKEEPDWELLPPELPGNINTLIRHCLRKDAARRLRHIGDANLEIEDALVELRVRPQRRVRDRRKAETGTALSPAEARAASACEPSEPSAMPHFEPPAAPSGIPLRVKVAGAIVFLVVAVAAFFLLRPLRQPAPTAPPGKPAGRTVEKAAAPAATTANTAEIFAVFFDPDGRTIGSGSGDQTVRLWDRSSGQLLHSYASQSRVLAAASSPDGSWLASGNEDGSVHLWNKSTSEQRVLSGHTRAVTALAFSPSGHWLATAGQEAIIKLWDTTNWGANSTLPGHKDWVRSVAFSPDGRLLASASDDRTVRIWDVASRAEQDRFSFTRGVPSLAFSPDGRMIVAGTWQNIELWDVAARKMLRKLPVGEGWVATVCFSPDGKSLASGNGRTVTLWEPTTGHRIFYLMGHTRAVSSCAFSPDSALLATASWDKTIRLWQVATGLEIRTLGIPASK